MDQTITLWSGFLEGFPKDGAAAVALANKITSRPATRKSEAMHFQRWQRSPANAKIVVIFTQTKKIYPTLKIAKIQVTPLTSGDRWLEPTPANVFRVSNTGHSTGTNDRVRWSIAVNDNRVGFFKHGSLFLPKNFD